MKGLLSIVALFFVVYPHPLAAEFTMSIRKDRRCGNEDL